MVVDCLAKYVLPSYNDNFFIKKISNFKMPSKVSKRAGLSILVRDSAGNVSEELDLVDKADSVLVGEALAVKEACFLVKSRN